VHGHDQRAEFPFTEILDLINQDGHGRFAVLGGLRHDPQQFGKVDLDVSAVCGAFFRLYVDPDRDVIKCHLDTADKALQDRKATADFFLGSLHAVEPEEQAAELRREHCREGFVLVSLDKNSLVALGLGQARDFIEEHRLSYSP